MNTHVWALEITLEAEKRYENPFKEVELVGQFDGPNGERLFVPGFWDGEGRWKLRFAPPAVGTWRWTTLPSDLADSRLRRQGTLLASPWLARDLGANPNRRGFLKVHPSGHFFTYADGTPFYWLGDTLWAAHTARCDPEEALPRYLAGRRDKGFSVIQLVAGHPTAYPGGEDASGYNVVGDAPELYANEGGFPYARPFDLINPAYFGALNRRKDPEMAGRDILAMVIPEAKKRGMKVFIELMEPFFKYAGHGSVNTVEVPNLAQCLEVDLFGRFGSEPSTENADYRNRILSMVEDQVRSYDLDGVMWCNERKSPLDGLIHGEAPHG